MSDTSSPSHTYGTVEESFSGEGRWECECGLSNTASDDVAALAALFAHQSAPEEN